MKMVGTEHSPATRAGTALDEIEAAAADLAVRGHLGREEDLEPPRHGALSAFG
jgi:hypothetical protein